MKTKLHNRILSALLMLSLLVSGLPVHTSADEVTSATADNTGVYTDAQKDEIVLSDFAICQDGQFVENIALRQTEKVTITAEGVPENAGYQWQIMMPDGSFWVDIYEQTGRELDVTYALLGEMLSPENTASLRCAAVRDGQRVGYTESVLVLVEDLPVMEYAPAANQGRNAKMRSVSAQTPETLAETAEKITITVTYQQDVLGDGALVKVADPYVATVFKEEYAGKPFVIDEKLPIVPGYAPFLVDGEGETQLGTTFSESIYPVTESVTFEVIYRRVPVKYEVRFFMQNLSNDQYTEDAGLHATAEGLTGEQPDPEVINPYIPGYSVLFYQPDDIAADGSTVFEVYYDRNYYLMNFDQNGGFGVAPIYARYGTSFHPASPTRHGYTFRGWDLDETDALVPEYEEVDGEQVLKREDDGSIIFTHQLQTDLADGVWETFPARIPNYDCTFVAKWEKNTTTYTRAYWVRNADNNGYSFIKQDEIGAVSGTVLNHQQFGSDILRFPVIREGDKDANGKPLNPTEEKLENYVFLNEAQIKAQYKDYTVELDNGTTQVQNGVIVEGDGSTVFNIYFDRQEFNLVFYYAAKYGGENCIIGGSTEPFGKYGYNATNRYNEVSLLEYNYSYTDNGVKHRGTVQSLPTFNEKGQKLVDSGKYTLVTTKGTGSNEYYGIQITAKYGANLMDVWPIDIFNEVIADKGVYYENGKYTAHMAGWTGEYAVAYNSKGSATIKGKYSKLDYQILYKDEYKSYFTDNTIAYQCFWENGAGVSWSRPRLWVYELYVPYLPGETVPADAISRQVNGKTVYFKKYDGYNTCDDNTGINSQTVPELVGYTNVLKEQVNLSKPEGYESGYTAMYFYTRNTHNLTFAEPYQLVGGKEGIKTTEDELVFGTPLKDDYGFYVPEYPPLLENNAYDFDGWYMSPTFAEGTQFWDKDGNFVATQSYTLDSQGAPLMPDANLQLYARWIPRSYQVEFFWNYEDMIANSPNRVWDAVYGKHNAHIEGNPVENPTYEASKGEYPNPHYNDPEDKGVFSFAGWFYEEGGTRMAFDPNEMVFTQNLKLYAEWKTKVTTSYTIRYLQAVMDDGGNPVLDAYGNFQPATDSNGDVIQLAEPTKGYLFSGTTRTFVAKAGDELAKTPSGGMWLPQTGSHSILMSRDAEKNTFDFYYVVKSSVRYTVEYRYAADNTLIEELDKIHPEDNANALGQDTYSTMDAVVSVLSEFLSGYTSSPVYKTLVMSLNDSENIITFYYTKNVDPDDGGDTPDPDTPKTEYNHYIIHYMLQDLEDPFAFTEIETLTGTGKFLDDKKNDGNDDLIRYEDYADPEDANYKSFDGFTLKKTFTVTDADTLRTERVDSGFGYKDTSGIIQINKDAYGNAITQAYISEEIVELWLFYERQSYDYVIKFLEHGTNNPLSKPQITGKAKYDSVISYPPEDDINGYDLVTTTEQTKRIAIETAEGGNYNSLIRNVIVFYYTQKQVQLTYTPVCLEASPDMTGWLSMTAEKPSDFRDSAKKIQGSVPRAGYGYQFAGWYYDADCTNPVPMSDLYDVIDASTKQLTPMVETRVASGTYAFRYYAKFEPIPMSVTIHNAAAAGTELEDDTFLFRITGQDVTGADVNLMVSLQGTDSVTINGLYYHISNAPYQVEQVGDWSWTYGENPNQTVSFEDSYADQVTFSNEADAPCWLNGESGAEENQFT